MKSRLITLSVILLAFIATISCSKDEILTTGTITGKVTSSQTREVLSGVTVTINPGGLSRTTGTDGYFEFGDLTPGQYEVQARKDDYQTNTKLITVVAGKISAGDIQLTPIVKEGKLALSVSSLNFGSQNSAMTFDIINNGNKSINWNISGLEKIDWLEFSPTSGTLAAGRSNAVQVTLVRTRVTEHKEATIIINSGEESVGLKITAEPENKTSKISLSTSTLNFGSEYTSLTFNINNIGNAGNVNWSISGINAQWITVTPKTGTTAMGKSSAVKVEVDRSKLADGANSTTILINADGESLYLTIKADKQDNRYIEVNPTSLNFGEEAEELTFSIKSYNGATSYELFTNGDASWASADKVEGIIPEYTNSSTVQVITLYANRTGLAPGTYSFTLIVRSDLGDYNIPVSMTVKSGGGTVSGEVISCDDNLQFTITSCKVSGTTATLEYKVENIGTKTIDLTLYGNSGGRSYIYDDRGNQYTFDLNCSSLTLGNDNDRWDVAATIPAGVYLKGSLVIKDFDPTATKIANATIYAYNHQSYLIFKNIAIEGRYNNGYQETPNTTGTVTTCNDDLEFTLLDCKRNSSNTVTISYTVENIGKKTIGLTLYGNSGGKSLIYDNCGNQYTFDLNCSSLTLGVQNDRWSVGATLPAGVYLKGSIVIKDVDPEATEIVNATIYSYSDQANLVFKNVKIRN